MSGKQAKRRRARGSASADALAERTPRLRGEHREGAAPRGPVPEAEAFEWHHDEYGSWVRCDECGAVKLWIDLAAAFIVPEPMPGFRGGINRLLSEGPRRWPDFDPRVWEAGYCPGCGLVFLAMEGPLTHE